MEAIKPTGITLTWSDVNVYASWFSGSFLGRGEKKYKRIINNATGVVKAGSLVALMGPSGAGKSTLMQALAQRNSKGTTVDGDIRINGHPLGSYVRKISGFMHQQDLFVESMTVREHLYFMARMKLSRSKTKQQLVKLTEDFIIQLGLVKCADTRIGGSSTSKVLSGGEKKRLAFASEMLTNPPLLFCDEPTTGLDSYSAQTLVTLMKNMALDGKTIVCTIHQPSSELFDVFHQLILLSEGRIAFIGEPAEALKFFERHGYRCPASYNPADFFIRCLALTPGAEDVSRRKIKRLCDEFAVTESAVMMDLSVQDNLTKVVLKDLRIPDSDGPRWMAKLCLLTYRSFLEVLRDPSVQIFRIVQKMALAIMVGLCFAGTLLLTQKGIQSTQGALFMLVTENTFGAMYSVLSLFPSERPLFSREHGNGLYSPGLYYLSKMLALTPGLIVEPVLFTIFMYLIADLRTTAYAFFTTCFVVTLTMNVATACGCFFSNAFETVSFAMACLVPFDYILMITSGIFIKLDSMPDSIGWFKFLSWLMYSNEAMSILQWSGVESITCDSNPDLPCLHNGTEVLSKYDFAERHLNEDIMAMVILYVIYHVLAFTCLCLRVKHK